ncbi:hypothetical protein BH09PSE6_BH09PSE6_05110 [soil metagenome]
MLIARCPSCESRSFQYEFSKHGFRVVECTRCHLLLLNPQPSNDELAKIYGADYYLGEPTPAGRALFSRMKSATARLYLADLKRYSPDAGLRLLEVGCGTGEFLNEARASGFQVTGVEYNPTAVAAAKQLLGPDATVHCGTLADAALDPGSFDVCVLSDVIEHMRDPAAFLEELKLVLSRHATLLMTTPSLDSWSAKFLGSNWMEFKPEHLFYFDSKTSQNLLLACGFEDVIVKSNTKVLTLDYIARHFDRFPVPGVSSIVTTLAGLLPKSLANREFQIVASGISVFSRVAPERRSTRLSVVVPAFNEQATVGALLDGLLAKRIEGVEIDVIVVESNSTDGTRAIVEQYAGRDNVRLVFQDKPRGKGNAVRAGLAMARGDYILIQDADLEYDLEDYDALLLPLIEKKAAFVLGARHGGKTWKMRQFENQWLTSKFMNVGHWFFTFLVNLFFGLRLKDPFTMFKVFRRDCLYGLQFKCNRFDFDFELLIKLVKKGYRPIEIPVNYRSRSFAQGKKVSVLRDPISWLWAILRLRMEPVDPFTEVERAHRLKAAEPVQAD